MRRPTVAAREKKCSARISLACEPRQLPLCQQDLCWLEAGATFFLTTAVSRAPGRTQAHENTARAGSEFSLQAALIGAG